MKKRLSVLIFCAVLFTAVYRVGFDNRDIDADINDVNGVLAEVWPESNEPNDLTAPQSDLIRH
jgi:hypothetical protein